MLDTAVISTVTRITTTAILTTTVGAGAGEGPVEGAVEEAMEEAGEAGRRGVPGGRLGARPTEGANLLKDWIEN